MDDRLLELHNMSGKRDVSLSLNTSTSSQGDDFMPEFTQKIKKSQQCLERVKENNSRMQEMSQKYSRATTTQTEKDLSRELEQIMIQNQHYSQQLKESLAAIKSDVEIAQEKYPDEPETQMKINQRNELLSKVQDVLNASSQISIKYQTCVREKLRRQTKILDENLSEKQLDEICNDPQQAQQLLQEKLYGQAPSIQLQNAVSDIQDKYKDIQKLEQSVQLVYQLFVDLAILVETQGQQLDNIEMTLGSAKTYINKGTVKLVEAKKDHQAAKKKICCIILIGVVILAVIIAPIVATT